MFHNLKKTFPILIAIAVYSVGFDARAEFDDMPVITGAEDKGLVKGGMEKAFNQQGEKTKLQENTDVIV